MAREKLKQSERERRESFKRRLEVGKHLMMLGNLAAGALIFGQAFSGFSFDLRVALVGLLTTLMLYTLSLYVMKGGVGL